MRVCWFGSYDPHYPRHHILQKALRGRGVEVVECHDSTRNLLLRHLRLARRYLSMPRPDVLLVGEQCQTLVPLAWLLGRLTGVPVVFDPFFSLYDTSVNDRRETRPWSPRALSLFFLDLIAFLLARRVFADTGAQARYYARTFGVPPGKLVVLPIGADEEAFPHDPRLPDAAGRPFHVLFYGTYIQLQGIEHIFRAVRLLEDREDIRFTLIGHGFVENSYTEIIRILPGLRFRNATLIARAPYREVARHIRDADLCLGIFGRTSKGLKVVPNKAYEAMCVGRPILTGDSPAGRELLRHGEDAWLSPLADGEALARAILHLKDHPELREKLARGGRLSFEEKFSARAQGETLLQVFREMAGGT